jgi:branched-chain amino acid transport system substrate-binding protein
MPLRGQSGPYGRDVADGARIALATSGGRAGALRVRAVYLDDTAGPGGAARWSQATVGQNARRATEDTSAVAYIGDFESGATRVSEPITNAAHLLQVSPASTAVDLTRPFLGSDELPLAEEEGGERTFGRVIPDDQAQAAAGAHWARRLGVKRVAVADDGSGFGRVMASAFRAALGGAEFTSKRPDLLYYAGLAAGERAAVPQGNPAPVMGSDALLEPDRGTVVTTARFATSAAQDPSQLPAAGRAFAAKFRDRFGHEPSRYAAYGYEAMAVVLNAVRRAGSSGDERQPVIDSFFDTRGRGSILGAYSIDTVGNTTLNRMTGYRLARSGATTPVALLHAR